MQIEKKDNINISNSENLEKTSEIVESINSIEILIEEMNRTFYEIVNDLEQKYISLEDNLRELQGSYKDIDKNKNTNENTNIDQQLSVQNDSLQQKPNSDCTKNNRLKILELKSKGFSFSQIAKELDIGIGEVQLILNMKHHDLK